MDVDGESPRGRPDGGNAPDSRDPGALRFHLLGPLHVTSGGSVVPLPGERQRRVLALLLVRAGRAVAQDALIAAAWSGEPPATAGRQVHTALWQLRRALDRHGAADLLVREAAGYRLDVDPEQVDVHRFEALVAGGRRRGRLGDVEGAVRELRAALALWSGPPFGGLRGDALDRAAARLEELRLAATEDAAELRLARDDTDGLVAELARLNDEHPLRERLAGALMLALYRTGRQAEALQLYHRTAHALSEELGIDPSAGLADRYTAILRRDPALDPTPDADRGGTPSDRTHRGGGPALPPGPPSRLREPADPPRALPPDVPDFVGRGPEVRRLTALLTGPDAAPVVVTGPGGIGKSALCTRVAHSLGTAFGDGQLYLDLHGFDRDEPVDPRVALGRLLRQLGCDGQTIPAGSEERCEMYRQLTAHRRLLVVLDNAGSDEQVLPLLPSSSGCRVLINGRVRIGASFGATTVALGLLDPEECRALLGVVGGADRIDAEPAAVERLVDDCGRLPLALRIAAARLAGKPHWTVERIVRQLDDQRSRLDRLSHAHLDVRRTIAWSYRHLPAPARALLRRTCALDVPDVTVGVAAALLDLDPAAAEEELETLFDAQLLDAAGEDATGGARYRAHDLVRLFGRERATAEEPAAATAAARRRLLGAYLTLSDAVYDHVFSGDFLAMRGPAPRWDPGERAVAAAVAEPMRWFEAERANLTALAELAARTDVSACWDLVCSTYPLFSVRQYGEERARLVHRALAAVVGVGDRVGEAVVRFRLGSLHGDRTEFGAAHEQFTRSAEIFAELGDARGEAAAGAHVSMACRHLGELDAATEGYARAGATLGRTGDVGGEVYALRGLGQTEMARGRLAEADAYFERAMRVHRLRGGSRLNAARTLYWRGILYTRQDRHAEAEAVFVEVLALTRAVGDRSGQAQALRGLGICQHHNGEKRAAAASFTAALQLVRGPVPGIVTSFITTTVTELGYQGLVPLDPPDR